MKYYCNAAFFKVVGHLLLFSFYLACCSSILAANPYDSTWRYPVIAIPLLEKAPAIDGVIDQEEWSHAALFPALLSMAPTRGGGLPPQERTWIWMGYVSDPPSPELRRTGSLYKNISLQKVK